MRPSREATLFVRGLIAHLVADWLLQNDWMARAKQDPRHAAAWVHAGLQTLVLGLVFRRSLALTLGVLHLGLDTRRPLSWWRAVYRQTTEGPAALHVAIWGDQVVHLVLIWGAAVIQSVLEGGRHAQS